MPKIAATELRAGLRGSAEMTVAEQHIAPHIGSGHVKVLATPVLVTLMEAAALEAVHGLLPEGYQSVGTRIDVHHFAATPVGMRVTVSAEVIKVDGRSITFRLIAEDEKERIGEGSHERIIINVARFDQRVKQKVIGRATEVPRKH
ncbi:MAG TPA: thioesterase family protein [Burkholderiales bacterium]|nr:thioesterase family protein [Burkholderiales bacterium]